MMWRNAMLNTGAVSPMGRRYHCVYEAIVLHHKLSSSIRVIHTELTCNQIIG